MLFSLSGPGENADSDAASEALIKWRNGDVIFGFTFA